MDAVKLSILAYLDIETLPTDDPIALQKLIEKIKAPSNYGTEAAAKWMSQQGAAKAAEALGDTAVDGTYGRVLAVACALEEGPPRVWIGEEGDVLSGFFRSVRDAELAKFEGAGEYHIEVTWIGHNVRRFDLRFLYQRAVIRGIKMPRSLLQAVGTRYGSTVIDTMEMWHPDRDRMIGIGELCRVLHIASPKKDMDGSMVAAAWAAGEKQRIEEYCLAEISALRRVYKRLAFLDDLPPV